MSAGLLGSALCSGMLLTPGAGSMWGASAGMLGSVGGGAPPAAIPLASDSFNRANAAISGQSTDGGVGGQEAVRTWAGSGSISSNRYAGSGQQAWVDVGESDVAMRLIVQSSGGVDGVVLRVTDASNHWLLGSVPALAALWLYEMAGGVYTERAVTNDVPDFGTGDYECYARADGNDLSFQIPSLSGAPSVSYSSSLYATNTKHGVRCNGGQCDNVEIWRAAEAPF